MHDEEKYTCARSECQNTYIKAVHNQIYCSPECCKIATNQRLLARYHENKRKIKNGKRICIKKDCDTLLSQYNKENICENCKLKRLRNRLKRWGWNVSDMDV